MKRMMISILIIALVVMFSACNSTSIVPGAEEPEKNSPTVVEEKAPIEEDLKPTEELQLNRSFLENVGKPFSEIFKDEPDLQPMSFYVVDAAAMCFTDFIKPYSYILFVTQYLPYDEYAVEAIESKDIRCAGIYTTVGELFPDFIQDVYPDTFFNRIGVEELNTDDDDQLRERGIAYYASFWYEQMLFQVFGGTSDSLAVMAADDIVTVEIPTKNEELINELFNDTNYPDGIGCEAAIERAREYRIKRGLPDCSFWIMRDGIIDALDSMGLPDDKVYIVSLNLDWEANEAERHPVYYVGYTSGEVFERSLY